MTTGRWLIGALALASTTTVQAAGRTQCVTPAEAEALAIVLLPDAAEAVGKQCAAALPTGATLRADLPPLAARWRTEGVAAGPVAGAAVAKLAGGMGSGSAADGAAMLQLMRSSLIGDMVKSITPATCVLVDRAVSLVAPLPAANLAGLVVMAMQAGGGGRGAFICEPVKP